MLSGCQCANEISPNVAEDAGESPQGPQPCHSLTVADILTPRTKHATSEGSRRVQCITTWLYRPTRKLTKVLDEVFVEKPGSRLLMLSVIRPTVDGCDFGEAINCLQGGVARLMGYAGPRRGEALVSGA